ncbi:MAG: hypothetical protein M0Q23_07125 [Syntrophales bacterium]|nr:hypothetical protein [Syntrophales bacterium]MCK9528396.1 hypothetical protein [Syntrophales bacterium]MDX9922679.1 hypothetical protein [Syntrophales bacterium]
MERVQGNIAVTVPKGIFAAERVERIREWMFDRTGYVREAPLGKPAFFNVELLHDEVWGGETELRERPAGKTYGMKTWRPKPAFFNVELLHDALWKA